jgi:RimJ/RimL family protein N-acetyltransferase
LAGPSRGRGIGTRAVAALLDRLAARDDVEIAEAHVAEDNIASRRLLERLGFRLVGTTEGDLVYRLELHR